MAGVLIGSRAMEFWGLPVPRQGRTKINAKDHDVIRANKVPPGQPCLREGDIEWHSPEHLNNAEFHVGYGQHYLPNRETCWVATLEHLYIIKRSHVWRSLSFAKHIADLTLLQAKLGDAVCDNLRNSPLYKNRLKATKETYGDRHPSLMKSNDDFFADVVKKRYVHDDIHEVVAYNDAPVYTMMKRDPESAMCEKDMWDALPLERRIEAVKEEAMVIALERFLIPANYDGGKKYSERVAFLIAVEKICTTLTSGWFRDFAIDHYGEITLVIPSYWELFRSKEHKCRMYEKP